MSGEEEYYEENNEEYEVKGNLDNEGQQEVHDNVTEDRMNSKSNGYDQCNTIPYKQDISFQAALKIVDTAFLKLGRFVEDNTCPHSSSIDCTPPKGKAFYSNNTINTKTY